MFVPMMKRLRIFFLWEQEKTNLGGKYDYIGHESSAATILDDTERCGLPCDPRNMCRFEGRTLPERGRCYAPVRYASEAESVIAGRWVEADAKLNTMRTNQAAELLRDYT
ncbi:uncharacterized protein Z519_02007 [Cladophialophora bantiana CBS 173.52]|uniref:Uncharacterized protein n=1 Tax=Cladophialophora bantiana (strain ATCC 10958 / CBS 173.52 / CDC B-1940 / NIH 8579) TaxID=1442370 RepID=A0A0D2F316_CLAB1|nr:uncharacterized protein Z519_02007 [Cladophialophora bantiana CBS 173.52]KIW96616.1 hypothetical protein Z519_02007 [Cladophialophora bantiana CBS 173.52]